MSWKIAVTGILVMLWVLWPAIRIPKGNPIRRRIGAFGTYLLIIVGFLALLQALEALLGFGR